MIMDKDTHMCDKWSNSLDKNEKIFPKVIVIILNWNTWEHTIECLESLYQIDYPNWEVVVIDNDSSDNSVEKIKEYAEGKIKVFSKFISYLEENKPIHVIEYTREQAENGGVEEVERRIMGPPSNKKLILVRNEENYGFAEGNNIGIRYALYKDPDYILLLNNDVTVDRRFLSELVNVAESDGKIGIVGSKIYDYYKRNLIQCAGGYINLWLGKIKTYGNVPDTEEFNNVSERDFVWATSALIRSKLFKKIGLLDPHFFFGIEEYDYCIRAKKEGYRIVYIPSSKVWHKGGASFRKSSRYGFKRIISKRKGFLSYKLFYRLYKKHLPPLVFVFPYCLYMLRSVISVSLSLFKYLLRGEIEKIKEGWERIS